MATDLTAVLSTDRINNLLDSAGSVKVALPRLLGSDKYYSRKSEHYAFQSPPITSPPPMSPRRQRPKLTKDKRLMEVQNATFYWSKFLKMQLEAIKAKFTALSVQLIINSKYYVDHMAKTQQKVFFCRFLLLLQGRIQEFLIGGSKHYSICCNCFTANSFYYTSI